jgi:hypothetical protein
VYANAYFLSKNQTVMFYEDLKYGIYFIFVLVSFIM